MKHKREIKFRAWQDNEMLYQEKDHIYGIKEFIDKLYIDCDFMQYTGLKDKTGKEIYYDDLININGFSGNFRVILDDNSQSPRIDKDPGYFLTKQMQLVFKIIGNIYESPELLKENK